MAQKYVSQQPQGHKNHIEKVAIVGAGGNVGKYITQELLSAGTFTITALTRPDSTVTLPSGVTIKKIDYASQESLISALQGQDALIITMGTRAPAEQQSALIEAAASANVPFVLPNEWGYDIADPDLSKDIPIGEKHAAYRAKIEELGKSAWIGVTCGFWYEFSLSHGSDAYGFDLKERKVTFFDDGETKINTSTWAQCGRGVAKLLALPVDAKDGSPCLTNYKNRFMYISSFNLSQRDILASVMRVTGTKEEDWKIEHEESTSRYKAAMEAMMKGDMSGFVRVMYTRVFYQDGKGNFEKTKGLQNGVLGLPKEDLDEYTKIAIEMSKKEVKY